MQRKKGTRRGNRQGTEVGTARTQVGQGKAQKKRHQERKWAGQGNRQGMEYAGQETGRA